MDNETIFIPAIVLSELPFTSQKHPFFAISIFPNKLTAILEHVEQQSSLLRVRQTRKTERQSFTMNLRKCLITQQSQNGITIFYVRG